MEYSDDECIARIAELDKKYIELTTQLEQVNFLRNNLETILTKTEKVPHQDGSVSISKTVPLDPRTREPFDKTTRDKIFAKCHEDTMKIVKS